MKKPKNDASRAALCLRYSTQEQGDNLYTTIDAQRAYLTDYAAKNGLTVVGEYTDEAVSGRTLKRKGYRAMIEGAKARQFDAVLVTFMDRLGRGKAFDIAEHELGQCGVRVIHAAQDFGTGVAGYIGQTARKMIDGVYPELVKEWTEAKILWMLKEGYHCSGRAPFGYDATPVDAPVEEGKRPPKRLVPNPEKSEIVREAYRRAADGDTKACVRRYLMGATGEEWSFDRVTRLLTSRVYLGEARWGRHENPAAHLPLVDRTLFAEAQEALTESKRPYVRSESGDAQYYLRGLTFCACGGRMTPSWAKGRGGRLYRYYICMGKRDLTCTGPGRVSADRLHQGVFIEAAAMAKVPWRLRTTLEAARKMLPHTNQAKQDIANLRREIARLKREEDRFLAAIRVSPTSAFSILTQQLGTTQEAILTAGKQVVAAEIAQLGSALPTQEEFNEVISRLDEWLQGARDEERSQIAALLFHRVAVHKGNIKAESLLATHIK